MSLSLHEAVFPTVITMLGNLSRIIDKAAEHCETRKIEPSVVLNYRLAPDMFAFGRQIQIVTDQAKGMAARLACIEIPSYPDTESTFAELKTRLAKTADFVKDVTPAQVDGAETREIVVKMRTSELRSGGHDYVFRFFLPNFYFHAATAYGILRHVGVDLGKKDFLGAR